MGTERRMRAKAPTYRLLFLAAVLALTACGGGEDATETPRPVLVVRPVGDGSPQATAFAGEIRAREESPLSFRIGGQVVRRLVDAGDRVKRGELLAELDPGDARLEVDAAQAQAAAADAELARASAERKRFDTLAKEQLVSRSAAEAQDAAYAAAAGNARAAHAQLDVARNQKAYTQLRAPRDGVIAERKAEAGQTVASGQVVYTLAGAGGREVAMALPEVRFREFAVGQPVLVELWSRPGERLPGRIREISAAADPATRTYATRIALDAKASAEVDLGQSARVYVAMPRNDKSTAMRLPLSALQRGPNGATAVWVVDAAHTLHLTPVRVGPFGEDSVPVLSGLRAEDWVVAAGGHLLREGQAVAPVDRENRPVALATKGG